MEIFLIIIVAVGLAYANGANDNFKGVATLLGSGTSNYRAALLWATVTTLLGSLTAVWLAGQLLHNFSGKGLVAASLVADGHFVAAVALGAAVTILLATWIGMPISTTHSLIGGLLGAAWSAGSAISGDKLANSFFLPLLLSPPLAVAITVLCYLFFRRARQRLGVTRDTCFCVGTQTLEVVTVMDSAAAMQRAESLSASIGDTVECRDQYAGQVLGIDAAATLDRLHFLSAGSVSFARGLNDTPKIAALLLFVPRLSPSMGVALIAAAIAVGGWISARRVAEVMSSKITRMNHGQGFTANLVTAAVVIGASRLGMPVSTTHVSCGSLFGIGALTGNARWKTIATILLAWVTTLPVAALLAALAFKFTTVF